MTPDRAEHALILADDDEENTLDLVRVTLEQAGHETLGAADGEEALRLALEHRPHVCVLDVGMPERTGFEVLGAVRRTEHTAEVPVLLLTATVQERQLSPGLEFQADDYLTKPFSPRRLQGRVAALLHGR